eukprot:3530479-Prymnesium_polylepis.1
MAGGSSVPPSPSRLYGCTAGLFGSRSPHVAHAHRSTRGDIAARKPSTARALSRSRTSTCARSYMAFCSKLSCCAPSWSPGSSPTSTLIASSSSPISR